MNKTMINYKYLCICSRYNAVDLKSINVEIQHEIKTFTTKAMGFIM